MLIRFKKNAHALKPLLFIDLFAAQMKHSFIASTKGTNRLKLDKWQSFSHYAIVPFLLIVPVFTTYQLFNIYITGNYTGRRTAQELPLSGYIFLLPAVLMYFVQKRRLRYKEINLSATKEQFRAAVKLTAEKLDWTIQQQSGDFTRAIRHGSFTSGSWGELIVIIWQKDKILINSICDPDNKISVASYGWNKKNIDTFKIILEELVKVPGGCSE
jgi:hypothetical protein